MGLGTDVEIWGVDSFMVVRACMQAREQETRREEGYVPGQGSGEEEDGRKST